MDKFNLSTAIFVFGSNEGGFHGAGAAAYAERHKGAKRGLAFGLSGQSFAIPTKDKTIRHTLPLDEIKRYVDSFLWQARGEAPNLGHMKDMQFQVTRIGCGLAGLHDTDIAPMFDGAPDNCWFDSAWAGHIGIREDRIWGTF